MAVVTLEIAIFIHQTRHASKYFSNFRWRRDIAGMRVAFAGLTQLHRIANRYRVALIR